MKVKFFVFIISIFAVTVSFSYAKGKRYDVKSGIVEYKMSGGGNMLGFSTKIEGKRKLIFKDWGNLELEEETTFTTVMGEKEKTHQLTKIEGDIVYGVDFENRVIYRSKISDYFSKEKNKDLSKVGKDMLKKMGGKKIGKDKVLGYECEVWEIMGSKMCIYKGVVLKSEGNIMGMKHKSEAVRAEFDIKIDDDKFKLPDFPIKDLKEQIPGSASIKKEDKELMEKSKEFQDFMKSFEGLMGN